MFDLQEGFRSPSTRTSSEVIKQLTYVTRRYWCLGLGLVCLGLAMIWSGTLSQTSTARSVLANLKQDPRSELTIELSNSGFSPAQVQHSPGRFAIAVDNRTLSGEYTLKLLAEDGTLLHEIHVQSGSTAWTVNLQTGRYTLTETNHPEWTCSIVVQ